MSEEEKEAMKEGGAAPASAADELTKQAVADLDRARLSKDSEASTACELVRSALEKYGSMSEEVAWRACWTIGFLSSFSSSASMWRTELGRAGVCTLIVEIIKSSYASNEAVSIWACYAIGSLALRHEDNKLLLKNAGAVPCITAISSNNALSAGARQEAIKALVAMSEIQATSGMAAEIGSSTSGASTKKSKSKHAVTNSQGTAFAAKHGGMPFFEVSALSGENVAEAFATLVSLANLPDTSNVKIMLVGEGQVGKTSLLEQYTNNSFSDSVPPTVGSDFKKVNDYMVGGESKSLQLWDCGGDPKFKPIRISFYRGVSGVMLVYDVNNRSSFEALEEEIELIKDTKPVMKFVLVGNKCDA